MKKKIVFAGVACLLFKNPDCYDFIERNIMLPSASLLPSETAHKLALWTVRLRLPPYDHNRKPASLRTTVFGLTFDNPIGLAAGFDKDCEALKGLKRLGFGFIEVGSITPLPQDGNMSPRVFRLPEDQALINRYGFPSKGADAAAKEFQKSKAMINMQVQVHNSAALPVSPPMPGFHKKYSDNENETTYEFNSSDNSSTLTNLIMRFFLYFFEVNTCKVGINLGINKSTKNPTNDYCIGINKLGKFSDYIVINVSSPNTPGLRDLQCKEKLERMLSHISSRMTRQQKASRHRISLLLKISPDLNDDSLQEVLDVVMNSKYHVDGLIVSNTTVSRPEQLQSSCKNEIGGLSGVPLKDKSTEMIRKVYIKTNGVIPIIGVGGISTAEDAYEKIRAGATLVQLYTGLVYNGIGSIRRMKSRLCELLEKDGFRNVQLAVGADVPEIKNNILKDLHNVYQLPVISSDMLDSLMKSKLLDESFDDKTAIKLDEESTSKSDIQPSGNENSKK